MLIAGLAGLLIVVAAGQAVGPMLLGDVSGKAALTVSQAVVLDPDYDAGANPVASGSDALAVRNDDGTEFTVAMEFSIGSAETIAVFLQNDSGSTATSFLRLEFPDQLQVDVDGLGTVQASRFSSNSWLLTVPPDTGNGPNPGWDGVAITVKVPTSAAPGWYSLKAAIEPGGRSSDAPPEAQAVIGPSGGTIAVTDPESPLFGVTLEIPPGALSENQAITISIVSDQTSFGFGPIVDLGPSGLTFAMPITLTIPYSDADVIANNILDESLISIYQLDDAFGLWTVEPGGLVDTIANTVTVDISHFSLHKVAAPQLHRPNNSYESFLPELPTQYVLFLHGIQLKPGSESADGISNGSLLQAVSRPWTGFGDYVDTFGCAPGKVASTSLSGRRFQVWGLDYDSWRPIEENAVLLQKVLENIRETAGTDIKVSVVTHSMGGLVARRYVQDSSLYNNDIAKVMFIGTPHHGANIPNYVNTLGIASIGLMVGLNALVPSFSQLGAGSGFIQGLNSTGLLTSTVYAFNVYNDNLQLVGNPFAEWGDGVVPASSASLDDISGGNILQFRTQGLYHTIFGFPLFWQHGIARMGTVKEGSLDCEDEASLFSHPTWDYLERFLSDADDDGRPDEVDNCPATANPDQADGNHDGEGDACESEPVPQTLAWTRQFGSSAGDYGQDVSVDPSGNVYVAGYTAGALPGQTSAGANDAFLRKYDVSGTEVWTRQFGTSGIDTGYGVSVDPSGNVYVGGYTSGTLPGQTSSGGGADAFLRKYDAAGNVVWTRQFGTGAKDFAFGVSADPSGGVYIAGYTWGALPGQTNSGSYDAFLRKYDASGNELWTRQFGTGVQDEANAVSVDPSGNVYVAGRTRGALPGQTSSGGSDAFLRKYDASGNEVWTRQIGTNTIEMRVDVSVDPSGNAYVTGHTSGALPGQTSSGGADAFLRKYDPSGNEVWTRQFGSSMNDIGNGVSADSSGSVYVAGHTSSRLPGQVSIGDADAFLRKYDAAGNEVWTRDFDSGGDDIGVGVSADALGGVYIVGYTDGALPGHTSSGGFDAFLRRYAADSTVWTRQFGSGADGQDVSVDPLGNIYVAGYIYGTLPGQTSAGNADAFLRKYDAAGSEAWTRQFGTSGFDYGYDVSVDPSGNVYIAGISGGALPGTTQGGAFLRKYDASGTVVWTRQFGTSGGVQAVAADPLGNVYVAGYTEGALPGQTSSGGNDVFLRKYHAGGTEVWTQQFGTSGQDYAWEVFAEPSGAVYLVGETGGSLPGQTSAGGGDVFLRKYDASGNDVWTRQFGTSGQDLAYGVSVDPSGAVYVTGYVRGALPGQTSAGYYDVFLRKYDTSGTEVWTRQFGASGTSGGDVGWGVSVDPSGNIYVAGYVDGALPGQTSAGGIDGFLRRYDASGNEVWTRQFDAVGHGVAVDLSGNIYVTGGGFLRKYHADG